ncbi:MAG: hypothetical protein HYU88_04000 [Chloroflexi bacterium]|nr:hypothetical protein [Chloroflexota bacterium]MBI4503903.1 hypothetical protein [Chloroflexota bacterium]
MAPDEDIEVTAEDVESLDKKLLAFAQTLPDGEQAVLLDLVDRAVSGGEADVQGFGWKKKWRRIGIGVATIGISTGYTAVKKRTR